jgi:hypothetical protein
MEPTNNNLLPRLKPPTPPRPGRGYPLFPYLSPLRAAGALVRPELEAGRVRVDGLTNGYVPRRVYSPRFGKKAYLMTGLKLLAPWLADVLVVLGVFVMTVGVYGIVSCMRRARWCSST